MLPLSSGGRGYGASLLSEKESVGRTLKLVQLYLMSLEASKVALRLHKASEPSFSESFARKGFGCKRCLAVVVFDTSVSKDVGSILARAPRRGRLII